MKIREIRRGVEKLNPEVPRKTGDVVFIIRCDCGKKLGWTKLSMKPGSTDLGPRLRSLIPDQLNISAEFLAALIGCTKYRSDYLVERGHVHG